MKRSKYLKTQYLSKEELDDHDREIADHNRAMLWHYIRTAVIFVVVSLVGGYVLTIIN